MSRRRSFNRARIILSAILTFFITSSPLAGQETEASLERLNRLDDLLKFLDARPGALIADVGAGDGFYTVRIARVVSPNGRTVAVDVSESALNKLRERAARENASNVDVILGAPDD